MSKQTQNLFTGEFSSKLNCTTCGKGISKCEPFLHVSLPVYDCDDLEECLQNFTSIENLTMENGFDCKKCKTKVMAAIQMTTRELPQILLIHLKLFNADLNGSVKIKKHVDFDLTINLTSYLTNDNQCGQYDLCSVLVHAGESAHTGHYYAFKKENSAWLKCDDNVITQVTEAEVLEEHAYILCYEKATAPDMKVAAATATVGSAKTQEKQVVVAESQSKNTKKEVGYNAAKLDTVEETVKKEEERVPAVNEIKVLKDLLATAASQQAQSKDEFMKNKSAETDRADETTRKKNKLAYEVLETEKQIASKNKEAHLAAEEHAWRKKMDMRNKMANRTKQAQEKKKVKLSKELKKRTEEEEQQKLNEALFLEKQKQQQDAQRELNETLTGHADATGTVLDNTNEVVVPAAIPTDSQGGMWMELGGQMIPGVLPL